MARTKGTYSLSANIETNAAAPLDARDRVATLADLTASGSFPYPWIGMETYVTAENKKYRLIGADPTVSANWEEVGNGGGGGSYSDFTGASSTTAGTHGLVPAPAAGDQNKILYGDGSWGLFPSIDMSGASIESDLMSTDEKPIGMFTNNKIMYQKTCFYEQNFGSNETSLTHNISNIETICGIQAIAYRSDSGVYELCNGSQTGASWSWGVYDIGTQGITFWKTNNGSINKLWVTLKYTKTTDSALDSDERYAGLTNNGAIIYKKWVSTGGNVPSGATLIYRQALLTGQDIIYYTK